MRLPWIIVALAVPYFVFSVWALESHRCLELVDYLGDPPPERVFWCGDLRFVLGTGYFIAPIVAVVTLGVIAFRWVMRQFYTSN